VALDSDLRDCCARRSRTGVDGCSLGAAVVLGTLADGPLVALLALGIPRFSARLVAIEDWGSLRRDVGGVGEDVLDEDVRDDDVFSEGERVDDSEGCLVASVFFLSLGGASLIRPASLRWWSSSRLRMRRAWNTLDERDSPCQTTYLSIVSILGGIVKGGRGEVMLLPRGCDAVGARGSGGSARVVVGLDEVCRLHGAR
jgi:hypothetical protein